MVEEDYEKFKKSEDEFEEEDDYNIDKYEDDEI